MRASPDRLGDFAPAVIAHLADQIAIAEAALDGYDWTSRTGRRHRQEILDALGVRPFGARAEAAFRAWLLEDVMLTAPTAAALEKRIRGLDALNQGLPGNPTVRLDPRRKHPIIVTPLDPQPEPPTLEALKRKLSRRWPMIGLLDIVKEADLRIGFTGAFATAAQREATNRIEIQRRLLLCLYGLGTNARLKRLSGGRHGV